MADESPSSEFYDAVDWHDKGETSSGSKGDYGWIAAKEKELSLKEGELAKMENEVYRMKKIMEEEQKVNAKNKARQYQLEREVGQLRMIVTKWEQQEEERVQRKREKEREER